MSPIKSLLAATMIAVALPAIAQPATAPNGIPSENMPIQQQTGGNTDQEAARLTLEQMAAMKSVPPETFQDGMNAQLPPSMPALPLGAANPVKPAPIIQHDRPRLVAILGAPGKEHARIAFDGFVYTVSSQNQTIGDSGWALKEINVEARTVILRKGSKTIQLGTVERERDIPQGGNTTAGQPQSWAGAPY